MAFQEMYDNWINDPRTQMGFSLLSQYKRYDRPGSLADAMSQFQGWKDMELRRQMTDLMLQKEKRAAEKDKKKEQLVSELSGLAKNYYKPPVQGALEQNMIGPGIGLDSQQGRMMLEQELGPGVAGMVSKDSAVPAELAGTLADTMQRLNSSANYVQQGTLQEMPLVSQPGMFDQQGFKQAAFPKRLELTPEDVLAEVFGGTEANYMKPEVNEQGNYVLFDQKSGKMLDTGVKAHQKTSDGYKDRKTVLSIGGVPHYQNQSTNDGGRTWFNYGDPYPIKSTVANVSAEAKVGESGLTEFWKGAAKGRSDALNKSAEAAEASADNLISLNRFLKESARGTAGGFQPLITGAQNLLASFGFSSNELVSTTTMAQAIASNKAAYMKQLGARGLTDQDMKILGEALPQVQTSRQARETVARILIKSNKATVDRWARDFKNTYENVPPGMEFLRQYPAWYQDYINQVPDVPAPKNTPAPRSGGGAWKDM